MITLWEPIGKREGMQQVIIDDLRLLAVELVEFLIMMYDILSDPDACVRSIARVLQEVPRVELRKDTY
jgi:hypothetical protein